ncbi:MAG TPA: type II secretion system protein GspN [Anaeromyxobacteraceae bacterium]
MDLDLKLKPWQRRAAYGAFAFLAFVFALRQTFPTEAVKERLIMEAAAQGWLVHVADVRPAGLAGVGMTSVSLESREGLRIPIEQLDATLRPLALLLGRRGFSFDARLFEGRVKGFFEEGKAARRIVASISGVDLSRAVPLRKATGLDLTGLLQGQLDLSLDDREPAKSAGHLDLSVERAGVNGGELPVPGMGGALTIPKVGLGQVTARAVVKDGRMSFEKLEAKGDDLEATGEGLYCVLQPRLAFAPIFGKAHLKLRDGFWQKSGTAGFKSVVDMALASARARDGSYGFQIFGTLSQPQARMAP